MLRIGIVGTGFIVHYMLDNMKKVPDMEPVAIYSRKEETGLAVADAYHFRKVYTDYEKMLQDDEIDVIYIASPNSVHYGQAKAALLAGKHVLCEKPMTAKASEARELIELARSRQQYLLECTMTMYHPAMAKIKEAVKEIGGIKIATGSFCQRSSRYDALQKGEVANVFNPAFAGGALRDLNLYNLHFMIGLFGKPDAAHYHACYHTNGVDLHGTLVLQYGDLLCNCIAAKDCAAENSVQVDADAGSIHVYPTASLMHTVNICRKDMPDETIELSEEPWYYELAAFSALFAKNDYRVCEPYQEQTKIVLQVIEDVL